MYDMTNGPWIRKLKRGSVMSFKVSLIQDVRAGSTVDSESIALPEKNCRFDSMKSEIAPQAFRWQSYNRNHIMMGNIYSCTIIGIPRLVNNSLCRPPKYVKPPKLWVQWCLQLSNQLGPLLLTFLLAPWLAAQDVRHGRDDSVGTPRCGNFWEDLGRYIYIYLLRKDFYDI